MKLAEQMGCTCEEAKERTAYAELMDWIAYWDLKREAEEAAAKGKDPVQAARQNLQRQKPKKRRRGGR